MKKIIVIHASVLAAILAVGIFGYIKYWNVATVNGISISRLDYIKSMEKQGGKQTLAMMIDDTLILNEGNAKGVKIEQKDIDEELAKIETQLKAQNETLESALAANNMTKADLEKQIRLKKIETALSAPKTEITQAQIDQFLLTNKSLLPTGKTKEELQTMAKDQLTIEASQSAASTWMDNLRQSAKIIYK
jgi:parvulin-like peptidyl-prolyl isomerase